MKTICRQVNDRVRMKLTEKDTSTKSLIWEATVLMKGHKTVVEKHALDVSMQIKASFGDENFAPILNIDDADLTLHENANQIIIRNKQGLKSKKNLEMVPSGSQPSDSVLESPLTQSPLMQSP